MLFKSQCFQMTCVTRGCSSTQKEPHSHAGIPFAHVPQPWTCPANECLWEYHLNQKLQFKNQNTHLIPKPCNSLAVWPSAPDLSSGAPCVWGGTVAFVSQYCGEEKWGCKTCSISGRHWVNSQNAGKNSFFVHPLPCFKKLHDSALNKFKEHWNMWFKKQEGKKVITGLWGSICTWAMLG